MSVYKQYQDLLGTQPITAATSRRVLPVEKKIILYILIALLSYMILNFSYKEISRFYEKYELKSNIKTQIITYEKLYKNFTAIVLSLKKDKNYTPQYYVEPNKYKYTLSKLNRTNDLERFQNKIVWLNYNIKEANVNAKNELENYNFRQKQNNVRLHRYKQDQMRERQRVQAAAQRTRNHNSTMNLLKKTMNSFFNRK